MTTRTFKVVAGTSVAVATNNQSPNILTIEGYCNGVANTQYWIQLHSVAAPVSGTTAPLRSFQVLGTDGFTFDKGFHGLASQNLTNPPTQPGLWVFLSSTDGVFTTPGITADINVDVEEWELELQGTTSQTSAAASIITALADGLPVISAPAIVNGTMIGGSLVSGTLQTNKLTYAVLTETNGVASFVQLFAALPVVNAVPFEQIPIAASATIVLNFGSQGKEFLTVDSTGALHNGIYIACSKTTGLFDNAGDISGTVVIK